MGKTMHRTPLRVDVRPFADAHLAEAVSIFRSAFSEPPWEEPWTDHDAFEIIESLRSMTSGRGWVARANRSVVGFALGAICANSDTGQIAFMIQELAVDPSLQRRGIGSRLLRTVEADVRGAGLNSVAAATQAHEWLCDFYEKNGYAVGGRCDDDVIFIRSSLIGSA